VTVGLPEYALVALSGVTLVIQIVSWLWVRRLARRLRGTDGGHLISIISYLLGWTVVLRLIGYAGLVYFGATGTTDPIVQLTVLTQLAFILIVVRVWRQLRQFLNS